MISQSYMDELLMSVALPFAVPETVPALVRSRMTMPEYISLDSANFTETMICALTGHCAHQTCLQLNMCRTHCLSREAGKHFSNTNLSDLSIVGTRDIFVYRLVDSNL